MQLYVRDGKWHFLGRYWCEREHRRKRLRRSTGVEDDGTVRSKRFAEQNAHKILQSFASGAGRRTRALTLEAAIKIHIGQLELADKSQATINIVLEKAVHLYDHFGPDRDVSTIDEAALNEYAQARLKQWAHPPREEEPKREGAPGPKRRRKRGYAGKLTSRATVERELQTYSGALRSARAIKRFEGPIPTLPNLGESQPKERWLPKAESQRVLLALNARWRDHFVVYRQMGLDRMELYEIGREDIDWPAREIFVRGSKNKYRRRRIPMTDEVFEIFRRRVNGPERMFDFWHSDLRDLKAVAARLGFEEFCLKDLRRSFATELAIAGKPILLVMHLMGHASTRMLEKVYARVGRGEHMHDVIRAVSELRPAARLQAVSGEEDPE